MAKRKLRNDDVVILSARRGPIGKFDGVLNMFGGVMILERRK